MAGVRIVARDGGAPSAGALLTATYFAWFDSLPLFYGVGLVAVVLTRDNLRIVATWLPATRWCYDGMHACLRPPATRQRLAPDARAPEIVASLSSVGRAAAEARVRSHAGVDAATAADPAESRNHDGAAWRTRA